MFLAERETHFQNRRGMFHTVLERMIEILPSFVLLV